MDPANAIFVCGAECGLTAVGTASGGVEHYVTFGSNCTVVTSGPSPMRSTRCFRINPTAGSAGGPSHTLATAVASGGTVVQRVYVYFTTLPDITTALCTARGTTSLEFMGAYFHVGSSEIRAGRGGSTTPNTGVAVTTGTWYRLDIKTVWAATHTVDVKVNGTDCTQYSTAIAAETINQLFLGSTTGNTTTCDLYLDDHVASSSSGDYPIGDGVCVGLYPNADATNDRAAASGNRPMDHSWSATTDFGKGASGGTDMGNQESESTSWQSLDNPLTTTAGGSWIANKTGATNEWAAWKFDDLPGDASTINGVMCVFTAHASAATSCTIGMSGGHGDGAAGAAWTSGLPATSTGFQGAIDMSETTIATSCGIFTTRNGTAWTVALVNAVKMKFSSGDVNPDPYLDGVCWEVDYTVSSGDATATPSAFVATVTRNTPTGGAGGENTVAARTVTRDAPGGGAGGTPTTKVVAVTLPLQIGGFVPTSLGTMKTWLDPSVTASITESATEVSQIDDLSGATNHGTQSTAGRKPKTGLDTINGLNALTFDTDDFLDLLGVSASDRTETIFMVLNFDNVTASGVPLIPLGASATGGRNVVWNDEGGSFPTGGTGGVLQYVKGGVTILSQYDALTPADTVTYIMMIAASDTDVIYNVNSVGEETDSDSTTFTAALTSQIGTDVSGWSINGRLGEVWIFDGQLNSTNRAIGMAQLMNKWLGDRTATPATFAAITSLLTPGGGAGGAQPDLARTTSFNTPGGGAGGTSTAVTPLTSFNNPNGTAGGTASALAALGVLNTPTASSAGTVNVATPTTVFNTQAGGAGGTAPTFAGAASLLAGLGGAGGVAGNLLVTAFFPQASATGGTSDATATPDPFAALVTLLAGLGGAGGVNTAVAPLTAFNTPTGTAGGTAAALAALGVLNGPLGSAGGTAGNLLVTAFFPQATGGTTTDATATPATFAALTTLLAGLGGAGGVNTAVAPLTAFNNPNGTAGGTIAALAALTTLPAAGGGVSGVGTPFAALSSLVTPLGGAGGTPGPTIAVVSFPTPVGLGGADGTGQPNPFVALVTRLVPLGGAGGLLTLTTGATSFFAPSVGAGGTGTAVAPLTAFNNPAGTAGGTIGPVAPITVFPGASALVESVGIGLPFAGSGVFLFPIGHAGGTAGGLLVVVVFPTASGVALLPGLLHPSFADAWVSTSHADAYHDLASSAAVWSGRSDAEAWEG